MREEDIIEIIPVGEDETYDLEVEHSDHSFFANDISVSNSHALCYSIISFQAAWLLTYYPAEWFCAYLNEQPEEKRIRAIGTAKSMGFEIIPVDINSSGVSWEPSKSDKSLIQPLLSIKGLGEKAVEQIILNRPFKTVEDLLFNEKIKYAKLNKRALDVLIRSGACDNIKDSRFANSKHFWLATAFERPKTRKAFLDNIEQFKNESEYTENEKINNIVDLTGVFPLSMVVDEKVIRRIEAKGVPSITNFDTDLMVCWFIPRSSEIKQTKNGRDYMILNVLDDTCKLTSIKCWGYSVKEKVYMNRPYIGKLAYDEQWGFSVKSIKNSFKLVG